MNKSGIIYLFISIIVVIGTALFVLVPENPSSDDNITVTVMNTTAVISEKTTETTQTTRIIVHTSATSYSTETTTVTHQTTISSFSTNIEPEITSTEPIETETEQAEEIIFLDINNASAEELMKLDGIGEVTANAIISYREQNGGFLNIEEIMNVYGIGEAKFANIRDFIYVQNPVYYTEEEPEEFYETEPEIIPEEEPPEFKLEDIAPININTASIEELMLLPAVDEQIAQDIITLREQLHGFSHVYELLYVEKLEQKEIAEMENFVTVGQ